MKRIPDFFSDERITLPEDIDLKMLRLAINAIIRRPEVFMEDGPMIKSIVKDWDEAAVKSSALKSEEEHDFDLAYVDFLLYEEGVPLGASVPDHEINPAPECTPPLPRWITDTSGKPKFT